MSVVSAGYAIADTLPAINFTNSSGDHTCSAPSTNLSRTTSELLASQSPSVLCLNGVGSGVVSSTWQANLSNYTTYHNATSTLTGCPPLPNETGCTFFASNRYTANLSDWEDGAPTNSSTFWHPNETGYVPTDSVFYILLSFNRSTVLGGVYSLAVDLANATPAPVTFYVRTDPADWSGSANVTITFDATAAWTTLVPSSSDKGILVPEVIPSISGFLVSGSAPPCSLCSVTFTESGLPTGTEWYANITGEGSKSSTTTAVATSLSNGTYAYAVASSNKSYSAMGGSFTVTGAAVLRSVLFSLVTYSVTFTETGLSMGTNWSVIVEGATHFSTGTTLTVSEPNATYTFTVGGLSGYVANRSRGSVTVRGADVSVPLTFTSTPKAATFLGLPATEGYAGVAAILVVGVAAGVTVGWYRTRRKPAASPPTAPPSSLTEPPKPG